MLVAALLSCLWLKGDWLATHDATYETAMAGLDLEVRLSLHLNDRGLNDGQMPGGWLIFGGGSYDDIGAEAKANATLLARLREMCQNIITPWYRLGQDEVRTGARLQSAMTDGSPQGFPAVGRTSEADVTL